MPIDRGSHFQNCKHFMEHFGFYLLTIDCSLYEKTILGFFVHLFICEVTTTNVHFRFDKQRSQAVTRHFCTKCSLVLVSFLAPILLFLSKKKRFIFEKIDFKFCIMFNMISFANAQSSVKVRRTCSKVLLLISCKNTF